MALTKEQRAARLHGIGGSDAAAIMAGKWLELYEVKLGLRQEEDLEWVIPVRIGELTEEFNRQLCARKLEVEILGRQPTFTHPIHDFMLCNLDGFVPAFQAVAEFKHVNQFARGDGIEGQVERYYPQIMHNAYVRGVRECVFGVFFGTLGHDVIRVPLDREYLAELRELEAVFWDHVKRRKPPEDRAPVEAPAFSLDDMREVPMHGSNQWAEEAAAWLETREAAKRFETAKEELKALIPADARRAYGHGIMLTRAKNNALTVREYRAKRDDVPAPLTAPAIAAE